MKVLEKYLAELVNAQLENRKPGLLPKEVDLEELVRLSHKHQMNYLILGGLLKVDNIAEEEKNKIKPYVVKSVFKTAQQVCEIKKVEEVFEEKGIRCQPMKGSRMKFMYPTYEMREMGDIDILVQSEDMSEADKCLKEMGYTLEQSIKHHDIYKKKPYAVLEMHRAMYDRTVNKTQYEYFSDMSRAKKREGKSYIYDFTNEDFYVYMMAHMAKHFYVKGCGIRNLVDVYVYNNKYAANFDKDYVKEQLKVCGIATFTEHMEKLANIWLGEEESDDFYDELFLYMLDSGIYGKDENGIWNRFAEEKMKDKQATAGHLKMWYVFPPLSYMAEDYPYLHDYPFLLPVTWVIRGVGGILGKRGMQKRKMLKTIEEGKIKTYQTIYQRMDMHFK